MRRSEGLSRVTAVVLALLLVGSATNASPGFAEIFDRESKTADLRAGRREPSPTQLALVQNMGAHASWNEFGTPRSLIKYGGHLATAVPGADAASAARSWLEANKALFRLRSTENVRLVNEAPIRGSDGWAVVFRQEFAGTPASEGGVVTVGVAGPAATGWSVAYASSTVTGDDALGGSFALSATEAWLRAARDVGLTVGSDDIGIVKTDEDWSVFSVSGFSVPQRARRVAVPTPTNGVRPAYETLLVDGGHVAFQHFIDAETGAALVRKDLVHNTHPPGDFFNGQVPAEDAACASDHGPWVVGVGERVGSVQASAAAVLTTNDIVLHIVRNGEIVASSDTLFSPETVVYDPRDDGAGIYHVRVCDFIDGQVWNDPRDYSGQLAFSPVGGEAVNPYPPKWKVFPAYPKLGTQTHPWNYPSDDTREVWCWESSVAGSPLPECDREVQNLASRFPWDYDPRLNAPTFTTRGNNAVAAEAWTTPFTPGPYAFRPISPSREYIYPWTSTWHQSECVSSFVPSQSNDISAAVTNLFVMHNRMHDWSYFLGFTERHWNAQDSNFGTGGTAERDPLLGDVQAGAETGGSPSYLGRDNANMIPLPDGVPPITNMYLWQPIAGGFYAPCVDGDYDMAVVAHEYGHLIENRMIGKGGTRSGHHAGAMGESSGDLFAGEYLNEYNFAPVFDENPFAVGPYVTGNKERAIRNYNMSHPRTGGFPQPGAAPKVNPLNFSNLGYDIVGQQVHANGEIWSATNFDVRQVLIEKYNAQHPAGDEQLQAECADGKRSASECPGNRRWIQIMFDAYLLMPTNPSMLDARDAYLAADVMRFGGANQKELWGAFARRGFGENASSTNNSAEGTETSDVDPKPDFSSPYESEGNLTFKTRAVDEGGAGVPARIYVGHYEARVSPIADTDAATGPVDGTSEPGASNLDSTAAFVPGRYEFVVQAKGYGASRFEVDVAAGEAKEIVLDLQTNWASKHKGATASGDGANHEHLIDDTEATNWDSLGADPDVKGEQVVANLAGDAPHLVAKVNVSAMLLGQNRFTALRQFEIQTCNAVASNSDCSASNDFSTAYTSAEDAFPGFNPRPVAPEMILRTFELATPVEATHVGIVVLDNQCTGNPDFQGEQDADSLNPTDCADPNPSGVLTERDTEVHIAELQVFGPTATPEPPPPEADIVVDVRDSVDPVRRGQYYDYVVTVTNDGRDTAQAVTVVDNLPKGAGFADVATTQGTCSRTKEVVTCNLGDIAKGQSVEVTITVKSPDRGTVTNTAEANATSPTDPDKSNNSDTETTTVI